MTTAFFFILFGVGLSIVIYAASVLQTTNSYSIESYSMNNMSKYLLLSSFSMIDFLNLSLFN